MDFYGQKVIIFSDIFKHDIVKYFLYHGDENIVYMNQFLQQRSE